MRTAAYKVDVASDRRRRENVQGTFFFTHVSRSYASSEKKSGRYGKCFSMIGEKGGMVPRSMDA